MPAFKYPFSDLDRPAVLLDSIGSFWSTTYAGADFVQALLAAVASRANQNLLNLQELDNAVSRQQIDVFHTERWTELPLLQSKQGGDFNLLRFDSGTAVFADGPNHFDVPQASLVKAWPLPAGIIDIDIITNRISQPSLTLVKGIDFLLQDGYVVFNTDPFQNPLVGQQPVFVDNAVVDTQATLWAFRAAVDRDTVFNQFGYVLGLDLPSSQNYKALVNALLDAIGSGSSGTTIRLAWSAVTGAPVVLSKTETVDRIVNEPDRTLVITDLNVYALETDANPTVTPGQVLQRGDSVSDALAFYEFNRGQCPAAAEVPALSFGVGMLSAGYFQDLTFENKTVPLVISTDADGYTKLSWELGGWPGDIIQFFDDLHARGRAAGNTLASLMDQRPVSSRDTQPTAGSLPATVNPLQFLCQNLLRNNCFLVKVRPGAAINGTGLDSAKMMRKMIPPQTAMLVLIEIEYDGDVVIMEGNGTDTAPGYAETVTVYSALGISETLDPAGMIQETVTIRQIGGYCV